VRKLVLVNQTANYLFADILDAFVRKCPGCEIEAWYGSFVEDVPGLPKTVTLRRGPAYDRTSGVRRLLSWLRFHWWVRRLMRRQDATQTHFFFVSNPPLFVFLPGLTEASFDCLLYDFYPDVLGAAGQGFIASLVSGPWARRNARVLPRAQHVYTISERMKKAVCAALPATAHETVRVVPLWADSRDATEPGERDFRSEWGLENKKVLLYAGNLGTTHPLELLVALANSLRGHEEWRVVVVGSGPRRRALKARLRGMHNVLVRDPVPRGDLPALMSIAEWGCILLDAKAGDTSVPSKAYNLLAAGIPLLALVPPQSEIARLVTDHRVGLCFSNGDTNGVVSRIAPMGVAEHAELAENARLCSRRFTPRLAESFTEVCVAPAQPPAQAHGR
jgi:glycosyltransferase involved in cell wall biosynthesis